jgi:nickel transport system ATP-binding protein
MNKTALEISGLTIRAGAKTLVDGVSFSLEYGKTAALLGESGCGKTMTASAIMGLLPAGVRKTAGAVTICKTDTAGLTAEAYRSLRNTAVSVVMQNPTSAFDPVLTIFYHFWETLASHGGGDKKSAREAAMKSLLRAGFQDPASILGLYPFQMSGGMLQRVMLAIALTASPPLIIADEATTDLDVVSQAKILALLKSYCRENNTALLLITHDLSIAQSFAQEIILMKHGAVVERGDVVRFFEDPQSEYAKLLLSCHKSLYTGRFKKIIANIRSNYESA